MQRQALTWSLTGIMAVLGFMLTVQITSHPQASETSMSSYLDLRSEVAQQLVENKTLQADITKESAQLDQFKAAQGSQRDLRLAMQKDASTVAAEAGMTSVSGPGLTIRIKDDPKLPFIQPYAGQFSQESDQVLSQIVNDLFANGATAISINGQRLVTTSSIRLVTGLSGLGVLQVNTYPISPPYEITALGDVAHMQAVLTVNNVKLLLRLMQEDCVIKTYSSSHALRVPGYNGPLPGQWAKEVGSSS